MRSVFAVRTVSDSGMWWLLRSWVLAEFFPGWVEARRAEAEWGSCRVSPAGFGAKPRRKQIFVQILPARRIRKRSLCYGNVRGWLAVTRLYFIKTAKPILKLYWPSGRPIILVFTPSPIANSKANPFRWGVNDSGGGKIRFSTAGNGPR